MVDILHFSLGDVLVKYLVIELFWVAINKSIVQLAAVRLNHIRLPRGRDIGQLVVVRFCIPSKALLVHHLLVIHGGVFHLNQSVSRAMLFNTSPVRRTTSILSEIVVHSPVKALIVPFEAHFLSHLKHLI